MKSFLRERDGAILEYIILLSIIGIIVAFIGWRLYDQGWILNEISGNQYGVALGGQEPEEVTGNVVVQPLGVPAIAVLPDAPPYSTSTDMRFAANTYGGKAPYTYTWTNYSGGKTDGSMGDAQQYPEGSNEVRVTAKDKDGNQTTSSVYFNVSKGLGASVVAKRADGSTYPPPYSTGVPVQFNIVPVNQTGAYSCTWEGEYQGNSDCTGTIDTYDESGVVAINAELCDSTNTCVSVNQSISIGDAPLQGMITADPGTAVTTESLTKFKVDVTGGSGVYDIVWTNYTGGVDGNGAFGDDVQYPVGKQTIKVKICDLNMTELACIEPTIDINVTEATEDITPVKVSISTDPKRNQFFTTEDVKLMAMATGGQGAKTITWNGYNGGNASPGTWGTPVKFGAGTRTVTATACDTAGECASESIVLTVGDYSPVDITITSDPNRDIWDVEQVRFKYAVTGGTGSFDVSWTGYASGSESNDVYGDPVSFSSGTKTVSVTVCDIGVESYPCKTVSKTLEVKEYVQITSELIPENEVVWREWGENWQADSFNPTPYNYFSNESIYRHATYNDVFRANMNDPSLGPGQYAYLYTFKDEADKRWNVKSGRTYTFEYYIKSTETLTGITRGRMGVACSDGVQLFYSQDTTTTVSTAWQKVTFQIESKCTGKANWVLHFKDFPTGTQFDVARPSIDAGFEDNQKVYDFQNLRFKTLSTGGSGSYTVTWSNYAGGKTGDNMWGDGQSYTAGTKTVQATICDKVVTNQACVTKTVTFAVQAYTPVSASVEGGDTTGTVYPNGSTILQDDKMSLRFKGAGGSGKYLGVWTTYPDGKGASNAWGTLKNGYDFGVGTHTKSAKVCDGLFPLKPCVTPSYTFTVDRSFIDFDGVDDHLVINGMNPTIGKGLNSFTFESWVWLTETKLQSLFARADTLGNNSIVVGVYDDQYEFNFGPGSYKNGGGVRTDPSVLPPTGRWVHLAVAINGTSYSFYEDGVLLKTGTDAKSRDYWSDTEPFYFGLDVDPVFDKNRNVVGVVHNDFFKGKLNEFRVWNRALSETEIRANMNKRLTGNESGLATYMEFSRADTNGSLKTFKSTSARMVNF